MNVLYSVDSLKQPARKLPACPVEITLSLISSRWKVLILRDLMTENRRFGELQKSLEGISKKVLTENLRDMERDGIIHREVFPEVPPRVEYSLTPLGKTLSPILKSLASWGNMYRDLCSE